MEAKVHDGESSQSAVLDMEKCEQDNKEIVLWIWQQGPLQRAVSVTNGDRSQVTVDKGMNARWEGGNRAFKMFDRKSQRNGQ